ncbi:MAG: aminotransferase class V-fold PLP-dependent enzyme [Emcibacteraceae bacterium]|nr:aminotransferase class V-fold PLP-dependent enzyme [Emcibacteraceae bacterium]MDG1857900.1 aminotransferase class V-fold PLP-dependent enzyme [Emcibacteraceae bacterium]
MTNRRIFLKAAAIAGPLCQLAILPAKAQNAYQAPTTFKRDYYKEIGVTPFINAAGGYSAYGGARMRPEVSEAIRYGTYNKAKVGELHDAIGKRIAEMAKCEAAMVTSGATASMVLGTAACMTRGDKQKIEMLPTTDGMPNEIIIQKNHRYTYDRALMVAGAKMVTVANADELRAAIGSKTAMMFWLMANHNPDGDNISMDEYLKIAKENNIPTFLDGATMTPPASNVVDACQLGFDMVGFSGGKGLRGPYSAGLLLGKSEFISHAKANNSPNSRALGRGMKVASEEYLGMMVAFETALSIDEEADFNEKRTKFSRITDQLKDIPGLTTNVILDEGLVSELYLDLEWDPLIIKMSIPEFVEKLEQSTPSIRIRMLKFAGGRAQVSATVLAEGQDVIVGRIIREVMIAHS